MFNFYLFMANSFFFLISMMQEFHFFQCQESSSTQNSKLDMYLDESRLEWNLNMDVPSFWKFYILLLKNMLLALISCS